jgi:hypothetical protein
MKSAVWVVFALFATFWTGAAWLVVDLIQWAAHGLASGEAADLGRAVAEWPVPSWLSAWLGEPGWLYALQDSVARAVKLLGEALPWAGAAVGWLVPVVWTLWGLGLLLMLALAGGMHLLARRYPGVRQGGR